jgi:hypothetical protein
MDCRNVDAWVLESLEVKLSLRLVTNNPAKELLSVIVTGSVRLAKKAKVLVLESAIPTSSVSAAVKAVPANEANGT